MKGVVVQQVDILATVDVPAPTQIIVCIGIIRAKAVLKDGEVAQVNSAVPVEVAEPAPFGTNGAVTLIDSLNRRAHIGVQPVEADADGKRRAPLVVL